VVNSSITCFAVASPSLLPVADRRVFTILLLPVPGNIMLSLAVECIACVLANTATNKVVNIKSLFILISESINYYLTYYNDLFGYVLSIFSSIDND